MLNFLLENQNKISLVHSDNHLEEIKSQCSPLKYNANLTHLLKSTPEIKIIPHCIPDEDYYPLFQSKNAQPQDNGAPIFALFTSSLNDNWQEIMACKGDGQFAIRTGFYQQEVEIFHSILMGFQGLTIYVSGLDIFQIQYLTEVARDYAFSLFFVVHNREELNLVLETDAPYIIFSTYQKKNFSMQVSLLYNLSQFVPKSANLFALSSREILKDKKNLEGLGYSGLIVC